MPESASQTPATARPTLSVVIPMYEEFDNVIPMVERVVTGLAGYGGPWELICVDDGSRDGTARALLKQAETAGGFMRVIRLRRNFGQTAAMQAGISAARGELIATLDGDLQNDPADIPRMVDELLERDLDLLQGWRRHRQDALVLRKIPSRIANWLIGKVTRVRLHDYGCSLKVYRAAVIQEVLLLGEMHRFIPVWVAGVTAPERIGETAVTHQARQFGESKYGISRTFRVIIDLLSAFFFLRFGARPGHFFGTIGLVFGVLGGMLALVLGWDKFVLGHNIGERPLLFVAILFLVAAVQFFTTGVLAELLTRIFYRTGATTHHRIGSQTDPQQAGWKTPQ